MTILRILTLFFLLSTPIWADDTDDLFGYSQKHQEVLVVKVVASDLIVLEDGRHVKLLGIESLGPVPHAPIKYDDKGHMIEMPEEPTISIQEQALTYAQNLMENKKVKLEYDVDSGDAVTGYSQAYVYLPDGRMANTELLRMGFVKMNLVVPNVKYENKFDAAYQESKKEKRGIEGE